MSRSTSDGPGGTTPPAPLRVLVADDEPLARDCVRLALAGEPGVEVVAECGDGLEAVAAIGRVRPDLVLLDVQMPGLDGFGVVEQVGPDAMPPVVFVTAYDAHAVRAFALHALDYVLKPFTDDRFRDALRHARHQLALAREGELAARLAALLGERRAAASGSGSPWAERLLVRRGDRLAFVDVAEVDWLEAAGNYVRVHAGAHQDLVRMTLAGLLERLDPAVFARIHRSAAVNLRRVRELEPWFGGDWRAVMADGRQLRVSRNFREGVLRPVR